MATANKTALLVDPTPEVEQALESVLRPAGWSTERVADNRSALQRARSTAYGLIVTGEKTPGREDVELLRKLRCARPHTQLIILTDESTPQDVIDSMRARALSYFSKPFDVNELASSVHKAIEGETWDDGIEVLSATPEWVQLLVRCDLNTAERLVRFFEEMIDLPGEEQHRVALAFREMLMNAMQHGGNMDPSQHAQISYVRTRRMIMARVKDPGQGFAMSDLPHAAVSNPDDPLAHLEHREKQGMRPGGFGLMVAKSYVDEVIFDEKGNEVLLIKYLPNGDNKPADDGQGG